MAPTPPYRLYQHLYLNKTALPQKSINGLRRRMPPSGSHICPEFFVIRELDAIQRENTIAEKVPQFAELHR